MKIFLSHEAYKFLRAIRDKLWLSVFIFCLLGAAIILTTEVVEYLEGEPELIGVADERILNFVVPRRTESANSLMSSLTELGSGITLTILCFIASAFFLAKKENLFSGQLLVAGVGSALLTWSLKLLLERARPPKDIMVGGAGGFSYPSGHSLSAAAVYFTLAILFSKIYRDRKCQSAIWSISLSLILVVGMTRIYLGVHFFSDVVAGILMGVGWAAFVEFIFNRKAVS